MITSFEGLPVSWLSGCGICFGSAASGGSTGSDSRAAVDSAGLTATLLDEVEEGVDRDVPPERFVVAICTSAGQFPALLYPAASASATVWKKTRFASAISR